MRVDPRICPGCNQTFKPVRNKTIFCSHKCRANKIKPPLQRGKTTQANSAKEMTEIERAWFAGLFDGEGSIVKVHNKNRTNYSARITITSTFYPIFERILEVTGTGSIVKKKRKEENTHHSQCWHWQCYSANAKYILTQILPYLIIKKDKALEVINQEYQDSIPEPSVPHDFVSKPF